MSVLFGLYRTDGPDINEREMVDLGKATETYAVDGTVYRTTGVVGLGFQPYHTHARSAFEALPSLDDLGNCLTLDGRIDNHSELQRLLEMPSETVSDSQLLLAAFRRWGTGFFERIVGDWAIALWSKRDQSLLLARDHAGSRNLYYEQTRGQVRWSTSIDTFLADGKSRALDLAYTAAYLTCQPANDNTPYEQIKAVTPAHYVVFKGGKMLRKRHWQWMSQAQIRYCSDVDYEEHFLTLFRQSVERRTGPGAPILAHLSGGMDSTSIVCMSDHIRRESGEGSSGLLDTLSYYDESEPNWDERPYFKLVEATRQKSGIHLSTQLRHRTFEPAPNAIYQFHLPGFDRYGVERDRELLRSLPENHFRVVLSGIGGDEVLGGIPTPFPELTDYLVSLNLQVLLTQAVQFCLSERKTIWQMLRDTIAQCAECYWPENPLKEGDLPWINPSLKRFVLRNFEDSHSLSRPIKLKPSDIRNDIMWWRMLETLPHSVPSPLLHFEYRYPYLDRDLVDFLLRIPREQLVRPGRRRSLMRRALKDIVPFEILERRRKASLIRSPLATLQREETRIRSIFDGSFLSQCDLIDERTLLKSLSVINRGSDFKGWSAVTRAIAFEFWIQANQSNLSSLSSVNAADNIWRQQKGAEEIRTDDVAL